MDQAKLLGGYKTFPRRSCHEIEHVNPFIQNANTFGKSSLDDIGSIKFLILTLIILLVHRDVLP